MKKTAVYFILILAIIGGLTAYIVSKNKGVEKQKTPDTTQTEEEKKPSKEDIKKPTKEEEVKEPITGDFTGFTSKTQEVGTFIEDDKFTLESIVDTPKEGYHEFAFNLTGPSEPSATARYDANANVIKLVINNVEKDRSGIPYQGERNINKEGILRLYRNVSGVHEKSFYDIGLSQGTVFKLDLTSKDSAENSWVLSLYIKYPGEKEVSGNLGSSEFSETDQSISGVGVDKDASINSYGYSASGGVFKLVFDVSGSGDNPIPMASAKYNEEGDLVLIFESLKIDRANKSLDGASLPLGITLSTSRDGEQSVYTFSNLGSKDEFKLSANLSPNQIVIEIK